MINEKTEGKLILKISSFPLIFLITLLVIPIPFYLRGIFDYFEIMPLIIFLSGIVVIAIGAFWDFGAKIYLKEIMDARIKVTEQDIVYINRKQLKMTLIYILIGGIYFATAVLIYLLQ